ncbi:alpha/beta fold hydrolase [Pseudonocardia sp.]|jgi:triacylglycerol lipase|uniref:alpha/beta fold hydrolase n=1 Tax=Pseudonocardia sp. TaxID=60912 RepID=UPI002634F735|nr:alpha/beta fold hydrolase [Pseudonocardia sp.]MCW2722563.1 alpha/beta hydrolase fold protein [Pseudonocardia sp.]MDT7614784.1 triacylglycerol lipase [Pseudonocardiales bacterium]
MALVHGGLDRLAMAGDVVRSTMSALTSSALRSLGEIGQAARYVARTCGRPAGVRGLAVEWAWLAAHLAAYPAGLVAEKLAESGDGYRTDNLRPRRRSLVVTDVEAAGTPILLVHGIMDNRSVFAVFRRTLRRRGFGVVHAVNYSLFTGDVRDAAHQLRSHVERLRGQTGADKVHIVGHSLGGMIARYYVQRMGGSAVVDTLVTLGSPHSGTLAAYLLPTPLARQLRPGSELIEELTEPAPDCSTRFLVVWSRMDQMIVPQRNARLTHPDLDVEQFEMHDVGHLSLPLDPRSVHWVATALARSDRGCHPFRRGQARSVASITTFRDQSSPAS